MREFAPMAHGTHGWDEQYNKDVGLLFDEMAGAKANSILNVYAHSKTGNAHTLTGEGAVMRFFAKAPWTAGDTVTVNGEAVNPVTLDGAALPTGGFVSGMWVVAVKDGKNLQFLTQSYAGVFADIQTQLRDKATLKDVVRDIGQIEQAVFENAVYPCCYCGVAFDLSGLPYKGNYHVLYMNEFVSGYSMQMCWGYSLFAVGKVLYRVADGTAWRSWTEIPNTNTPQEYTLPLEEGIAVNPGHIIKYSKDPKGLVVVTGQIICKSGVFTAGQTVAVLPEGFRPPTTRAFPATLISTNALTGCDIYVYNNGNITVEMRGEAPSATRLTLFATFYADHAVRE